MNRRRWYADAKELPQLVARLDEDERARFLYTHHLGRVFATIAIFEHTLVWALLGTTKIKVGQVAGATTAAQRHLAKRDLLKSYTLGNLIRALSSNGAAAADIAYLKFVQRNRDHFIHRFFDDAMWPGETDSRLIEPLLRRLSYLEIVVGRAADRIWTIIARNGYVKLVDLGAAGQLVIHPWEEELSPEASD